MSAAALLRQAHDEGLEFSAAPAGKIKVRGPREVVARWTSVIVQNKSAILAEIAKPGAGASLAGRRAEVERLLDDMAAENERRRDWHAKPVQGWRDGRLEIRSILTGESTVIRFPKGGRR